MFIVYLIQHTLTREIYIGFTKDLESRLKSHNANQNVATKTKNGNGEWILIYAEAYRSERDARVRENKLKQHGNAKHGLRMRIKESLMKDKK